MSIKTKKILPEAYKPKLDFFQTEKAIKLVKDTFERKLAEKLSLIRVTAPRFLKTGTGLQDDLAGTQVPVGFKTSFDVPVELVHSLAKWKRHTLGKHGLALGTGIYADMDAIRKDEEVDDIHSIYVDQWDWESVISRDERSLEFLKKVVEKIYSAIRDTEAVVEDAIPELKASLPEKISFIHTEELEEMYPEFAPDEREDAIAKKFGAVFLIGIGHELKSGVAHDLRAADYDDWITATSEKTRGLNGDMIIWHPARKKAIELSSMGIRVDSESMQLQLEKTGLEDRKELEFHKAVIEDRLPLSIGGGIGQSRICMILLQKAHIGEVQSSAWPEEVVEEFGKRSVVLL